jgi:hypothetical protein
MKPELQYLPLGQNGQSVDALSCFRVSEPYVPSGHRVGSDDPSGQYPFWQIVGLKDPISQ